MRDELRNSTQSYVFSPERGNEINLFPQMETELIAVAFVQRQPQLYLAFHYRIMKEVNNKYLSNYKHQRNQYDGLPDEI